MQSHSSVGELFPYSGQDVLRLMNRMQLLSPALVFLPRIDCLHPPF
jgi:hypothetical protein